MSVTGKGEKNKNDSHLETWYRSFKYPIILYNEGGNMIYLFCSLISCNTQSEALKSHPNFVRTNENLCSGYSESVS